MADQEAKAQGLPGSASEGTPAPSNQAIDDAKAQTVAKMQSRVDALTAEILKTGGEVEAIKAGLKSPAALTVSAHIKLLHQYNEIRDVGQGLLGMVAEKRNCRVVDLYTVDGDAVGEFGVGVRD